jgi:hypothetical protein
MADEMKEANHGKAHRSEKYLSRVWADHQGHNVGAAPKGDKATF